MRALGETAVALELKLGRHGHGHPLFKKRRDLRRKATTRCRGSTDTGGIGVQVRQAGKKERLTGRSHLSTKEGEMAAVRESAGAGRRRVGARLRLGPRGWLAGPRRKQA